MGESAPILLLLIAADRATVAVLAGGVDRAYPAKHATPLERIVATGLVVESPCAGCPGHDPGGTDPARTTWSRPVPGQALEAGAVVYQARSCGTRRTGSS